MVSKFATVIAAAGLVVPTFWPDAAAAEERYWAYGDWQVHVEGYDTGEDWRVTCTAWTGGDGNPTVRLSISNGDGGPPDTYPRLMVNESAPRGYNTQMKNGQAVTLIVDQSVAYNALVDGYYDEDGILQADAQVRWQDAVYVLLGMKAGSQMDVRILSPVNASDRVYLASLNGFTAAYGKMMDSCGHSLEVTEPALD